MLRVISGDAKGRALYAPAGLTARPTSAMVREALFNILNDVGGSTVLDLFAGTGAIGIEALSRGAESAVFVDISRECIDIIKKNIDKTGFENKAEVFLCDAKKAIKILFEKRRAFDIIYIDPPYDRPTEFLYEILKNVASIMNPTGVCIVERRKSDASLGYDKLGFSEIKTKIYSNAQLVFLCYFLKTEIVLNKREGI